MKIDRVFRPAPRRHRFPSVFAGLASACVAVTLLSGCGSDHRPSLSSNDAANTISLSHSYLVAPPGYAWKRQDFGEGSLQQANLPRGGSLQLKREKAADLSAIVDEKSLHSLQVFAMELVSPHSLPPQSEIISAFTTQPFTHQGMKPLQEDRGTVNYANAQCARVSGKVEVNGSEKFKDVPFDFQITQLDCIVPSVTDRIFRLAISERARRGTQFVSEQIENDMLKTLEFR